VFTQSRATWIQSTPPGSTYLSPVSVVPCSPNTGLRSNVLSSDFLTRIIGLEIFDWKVQTKYPCGTCGTGRLQILVPHRSALSSFRETISRQCSKGHLPSLTVDMTSLHTKTSVPKWRLAFPFPSKSTRTHGSTGCTRSGFPSLSAMWHIKGTQ
jgi:hypothetical protein